MNKTKIEWTDYTWNPVSGCTKRCSYCYANRLAQGRLRNIYLANTNVALGCDPGDPFSPRFWTNRLHRPRKNNKESKIFVCDMGDLFDSHVPNLWIQAVINEATFCWWHTFQFLTKQPARAAEFTFPPNAWVGTTVDRYDSENWQRQGYMTSIVASIRFVSYEPLRTPIPDIPPWANWIIIGAMTGPKPVRLEPKWVQTLIDCADDKGIPVFLKDNLNWPVVRREWPRGIEQ